MDENEKEKKKKVHSPAPEKRRKCCVASSIFPISSTTDHRRPAMPRAEISRFLEKEVEAASDNGGIVFIMVRSLLEIQ